MRTTWMIVAAVVVLTLIAGPATADWDLGDGHKMHFPQMPDPDGWDVAFYGGQHELELADDWECSSGGPVEDIHFWVSRKGSTSQNPPALSGPVSLTIYGDAWSSSNNHSMPGDALWTRQFAPADIAVRHAGTGLQGWYGPELPPEVIYDDHTEYFQMNITEISDPYIQGQGNVYWLGIRMPDTDTDIGWKTSVDHWNDAACFRWASPGGPYSWDSGNMEEPDTGDRLDLAFVITPEPATLSLLAVGALALIRRRRKN